MTRKRDYKAEYQRRIARGIARGLSRSQARGHPKLSEQPVRERQPSTKPDSKLEEAFKLLRSGNSLASAAKAARVSRERLRRYIHNNELAKWEGRRWVVLDARPRKVAILTKGKLRDLVVPNLQQASRAGAHYSAAGNFIRSNDLDVLEPFRGQGIEDAKGKFHPFETDPNELHRLAALDAPAFHEIYEIIQK